MHVGEYFHQRLFRVATEAIDLLNIVVFEEY